MSEVNQFHAVAVRQAAVQQHDLVAAAVQRPASHAQILRDIHDVVVPAQQALGNGGEIRIILNEQYFHGGLCSGASSGGILIGGHDACAGAFQATSIEPDCYDNLIRDARMAKRQPIFSGVHCWRRRLRFPAVQSVPLGTDNEAMKKALVIRNVSYETEGMLEPLLRNEGLDLNIVDFQRNPSAAPRLEGHAGLVVMGGPMGANDTDRYPHLARVERLGEQAMKGGVPMLGVCLGAQIMAKALGARVYPNRVREVGWYDLAITEAGNADQLFSQLKANEVVLQWHGDTFDLPEGAELLASSPDCVNQAFRYGDTAYAIQFHLEILRSMIEEWVRRDAARGWLGGHGRISRDRILADTRTCMDRSMEIGRRVFTRFARLVAA